MRNIRANTNGQSEPAIPGVLRIPVAATSIILADLVAQAEGEAANRRGEAELAASRRLHAVNSGPQEAAKYGMD